MKWSIIVGKAVRLADETPEHLSPKPRVTKKGCQRRVSHADGPLSATPQPFATRLPRVRSPGMAVTQLFGAMPMNMPESTLSMP